MIIEWQEKYSTQVKVFDEHHKHFFTLVSDLYDASLRNRLETMEALTNELIEYGVYHFEVEEKAMASSGYDRADEHIAQHEKFKKYVAKFKKDMMESTNGTIRSRLQFFVIWLNDHIAGWDKELGAHLVSSGATIEE